MLGSFSERLLTMESTQPLFAEDPNGEAKDVAGKLEKPQARSGFCLISVRFPVQISRFPVSEAVPVSLA